MKKKQFNKIILFVEKHKLFIIALLLVPIVTYTLAFTYKQLVNTHLSTQGKKTNNPTPSIKKGIEKEEKDLGWTPTDFSQADLSDVDASKAALPDGSTQYSYASDLATRQKMIIVKNGLIVFQRTPVFQTHISDYTAYYGNPEFVAKGSSYWGNDAITYIYLSRGFAFVCNTNTTLVLEQMYFQPVSANEFKKTYDNELPRDLLPYKP